MLWGLILQTLTFAQGIMSYIASATYHFEINATSGQWTGNIDAGLEPKGQAILVSLMTIVHYGLDFVAQLTLLLPAVASVSYNTANADVMLGNIP